MAKKGRVDIPWHPDFRDEKTLPDIKAVRSAFFINCVVITITAILLFSWVFLEWQVATISRMLVLDNAEMAKRQKGNAELLHESSEFERWGALINEIQDFVGVSVKPSQFLSAIGLARTSHMTLSTMSCTIETRAAVETRVVEPAKEPAPEKKAAPKQRVYAITIAGSVNGQSTQATRAIKMFRERLAALELFKGKKFVLKPTLKKFDRDSSLEVYSFIMVMEVAL